MIESNPEELESDDYLIELIGLKKDFPDEAMKAYSEIYKRYWDKMLIIAERVTKDNQVAQDLVADTFNMVFKRAGSFKKGKIKNKENIRVAILSWMTTIMKNIFYDNYLDEAYKNLKSEQETESIHIIKNVTVAKHFDSNEDEFIDLLEKSELNTHSNIIVEIAINSENEKSDNLKKIEEYLSTLSDRNRDIILTIYNYYIPGKNTPSEILDNLEQKWGTTRDNIRQILRKFRNSITTELQSQLFLRK